MTEKPTRRRRKVVPPLEPVPREPIEPPPLDERIAAAVDRFAARYSFPLDPFQLEAIAALATGLSILVTAPTGTGKTVIAEYAVQEAIEAGGRVIYTTPLRALSAQKFRDFVAVWGPERVGMVTGETAINDDAPILVMTTEILRNRLVSDESATLNGLRAVVLDEFHFLADQDRGRVWEEVVLLTPRSVQLVCLSATIPNADEVVEWLRQVHGPTVKIAHNERAVPLDVWYYDNGSLLRVADQNGSLVARPKGRSQDRQNWDSVAPDVLAELRQHQFLPAIMFVMSRRRTEEQAGLCVELGLDLTTDDGARRQIERELRATAEKIGAEELALAQFEQLAAALERGMAFHHAGLVPALRELVERLFEAGRLGVVFATGTLALGINMPARTVILEQLSTRDERGWRPLHKREFLQMAGRAGRRGKDITGHIVVLKHPFDLFDQLERLLKLPPEPVASAFDLDYSSALYLLDRYGADGMAEMYRRSFATFHQIRSAEHTAASGKHGRNGGPVFLMRRQKQIEAEALAQARRLEAVLGQFGYWDGRRVTRRADFLRRFFHGNALLTSELVIAGTLTELAPAELAEAACWIEGGGRSGRGRRPYTLPYNLGQIHRNVLNIHRKIERAESDNQLSVSAGMGPPAVHGLLWRAARGESLTELCDQYAIDPGDIYGRLMDTAMWLRQLENTLGATGLDSHLADTARRARAMLQVRAGAVGFTPATEGLTNGAAAAAVEAAAEEPVEGSTDETQQPVETGSEVAVKEREDPGPLSPQGEGEGEGLQPSEPRKRRVRRPS